MIEVAPDIKFKKELSKLSKASLNECMQCGTCSVVCSLAPDENPFPRKEMIWAGWGLKERLMADTDVWLCHQCGDCSTYCPRGVKPADVLSSVRKMTYVHYARPRFIGAILSKPVWLPVAVLIPVVIITLIKIINLMINRNAGILIATPFICLGFISLIYTTRLSLDRDYFLEKYGNTDELRKNYKSVFEKREIEDTDKEIIFLLKKYN